MTDFSRSLFSYVGSTEDITSGYSSAEPMLNALSRTASLAAKPKLRRTEVSETNLFALFLRFSHEQNMKYVEATRKFDQFRLYCEP